MRISKDQAAAMLRDATSGPYELFNGIVWGDYGEVGRYPLTSVIMTLGDTPEDEANGVKILLGLTLVDVLSGASDALPEGYEVRPSSRFARPWPWQVCFGQTCLADGLSDERQALIFAWAHFLQHARQEAGK